MLIAMQSVLLIVLLTSSSVALSDPIDRKQILEKCKEIANSKKSFRALDRGKIESFFISKFAFRPEGVTNINLILDEIDRRYPYAEKSEIAYILGTTYRETVGTMRPIHEALRCPTEECIHKNVGSYGQPKSNGKSYYGRGFSQLTGDSNYLKFGGLLKLKPETALYDNPDLALKPEIAASILVIGMFEGSFTEKHKLSDYFDAGKKDWTHARKIVNPRSNRAPVTAGYAKLFYECITGDSLIKHNELIE
jgi:hypothetical protein